MRCRYCVLIVGPTCTSLIWATVKPCNVAGRLVIGTSTRTTAAVRRAFQKPNTVISSANTGTACALVWRTAGISSAKPRAWAIQSSKSAASRNTVSTSNDENKPMHSRPNQVSAVSRLLCAVCRPCKPWGTSKADTSKTLPSAIAGRMDKSGNKRQPMSPCSKMEKRVIGPRAIECTTPLEREGSRVETS